MTMSQIIVEHNPSEDKLKQLGVDLARSKRSVL